MRFFDGDLDGVSGRARILSDIETPDMSPEHRAATFFNGEMNDYLSYRYFPQEEKRQQAKEQTNGHAATGQAPARAEAPAPQTAGQAEVPDNEAPF
jgi:hypothetical protein